MISKNQINKRKKKKTNSKLVETIELAKKNNLLDLAKKLSGPSRLQKKINLRDLDKINESKLLVVGKVLGTGNIDRKISISALGFSSSAIEKLKKSRSEIKTIKQEIEGNKKLEGVRII